MKRVLVVILIISLSISCKPKGSTSAPGEKGANDTTHFFQVTQYIQKQLDEIRRTPYPIYRLDVTNGHKDSSTITTPLLIELSKPFLQADISQLDLKRNYSENVFFDQTTKTFTISYTTTNKDLEIQNIDVLLKEDGRTVKRVFIRKFLNYTDSSAIEQLSWKDNESFQINRLVETPGKKESSEQTTVVWNEKSKEPEI